jgi:hypothetical protein
MSSSAVERLSSSQAPVLKILLHPPRRDIEAFEAITCRVHLSSIAVTLLAEPLDIAVFTSIMETSQTHYRGANPEDMAKPNNPLQTVIDENADNADSDERYLVRKT